MAVSGYVSKLYVCDLESELPTVRQDGERAYAKDTGNQFTAKSGLWVADSTGGGGGPHTHPISDIVNLQTALDGKAADTHAHVISDITGLQTALDSKFDLSSIGTLLQTVTVSTAANTTPVNVTGLVFNFLPNSFYLIDLYLLTQAAAATTGHGFQFDTSVAVSINAMTFYHQLANTGTLSGGSSVSDDASTGVSSGQPSANIAVLNQGCGILVTAAQAGTCQLRLRSEVAAVSSCLAGSMMRVNKVA